MSKTPEKQIVDLFNTLKGTGPGRVNHPEITNFAKEIFKVLSETDYNQENLSAVTIMLLEADFQSSEILQMMVESGIKQDMASGVTKGATHERAFVELEGEIPNLIQSSRIAAEGKFQDELVEQISEHLAVVRSEGVLADDAIRHIITEAVAPVIQEQIERVDQHPILMETKNLVNIIMHRSKT